MSSARIQYVRRADATPEAELNALAACYRLILDHALEKSAVGMTSTDGDDTREESRSDSRTKAILPE